MGFEVFRSDLDNVLACADGSKGGCPLFDSGLVLKILMIQTLNNLSVGPKSGHNPFSQRFFDSSKFGRGTTAQPVPLPLLVRGRL